MKGAGTRSSPRMGLSLTDFLTSELGPVGLALLQIVILEIRVRHPHQPLPKLFQPHRLLRIEFPFPLQRRRRGIVFKILLRRLGLIVAGRRFRGFFAFHQQPVDAAFSKMVLSKGLVLDYWDCPYRRWISSFKPVYPGAFTGD